MGTPVYKAGLDAGDIVLKADGKDVKDSRHLMILLLAKT